MGKPDRFRKLEKDNYDVTVIGAGMGGLVAAAILARRGKSVLVLDQHYVAGGNVTIFRRPGYEFDVGLHYIGDCEPHGVIPRILSAAGVDDINFREMDPDGFETYIFPDFKFRVPRSIPEFRARLVEMFPSERRGIDRYIAFLQHVWQMAEADGGSKWTQLFALIRSWRVVRHLNSTLEQVLDTCTKNPQLRAILVGQNGTYALPPSKVSAILHAGLANHYFQGAFYPEGGGQILSDRLVEEIERHGGKVLLRAKAHKILVDGDKVTGVELENRHVGRVKVQSPIVISNADYKKTMLELVGPEHLPSGMVQKTKGYEMAPALGVTYLGIKRDMVAEGIANSNYWVFPEYDFEKPYGSVMEGKFHKPALCYITIASLKDPENAKLAPEGITNLQLMTAVPSNFEAWGVSKEDFESGKYHKMQSYIDKKKEMADDLIQSAEIAFPGLRDSILYQEEATPLTHERYTLATGGTSYGLAMTPSQFLNKRPGSRGPLQGLFLAGANLRTCHGVSGAMTSGVHAAARVLGKELIGQVMMRPPVTFKPKKKEPVSV